MTPPDVRKGQRTARGPVKPPPAGPRPFGVHARGIPARREPSNTIKARRCIGLRSIGLGTSRLGALPRACQFASNPGGTVPQPAGPREAGELWSSATARSPSGSGRPRRCCAAVASCASPRAMACNPCDLPDWLYLTAGPVATSSVGTARRPAGPRARSSARGRPRRPAGADHRGDASPFGDAARASGAGHQKLAPDQQVQLHQAACSAPERVPYQAGSAARMRSRSDGVAS